MINFDGITDGKIDNCKFQNLIAVKSILGTRPAVFFGASDTNSTWTVKDSIFFDIDCEVVASTQAILGVVAVINYQNSDFSNSSADRVIRSQGLAVVIKGCAFSFVYNFRFKLC